MQSRTEEERGCCNPPRLGCAGGRSQRRRPAGSIKDGKSQRKLGLKATRCALRLVGPLHPRHRTNTQWQSHIYLDQSVKRVAHYYRRILCPTERNNPPEVDCLRFRTLSISSFYLISKMQLSPSPCTKSILDESLGMIRSFRSLRNPFTVRERLKQFPAVRQHQHSLSLSLSVFLVESFVYIIKQMPDPRNHRNFLFFCL